LRKNALFLTSAGAVLLCGAGAAVLAQGARNGETRQSRISPERLDETGPPVIRTVPVPAPTPTTKPVKRSLEEELGDPVTPAGMVEGAQLCMTVVSPQFDIRSRLLVDRGWGYTSPRQMSNGQSSFEFIQFLKGERTIALQDYGPMVVCRVIGRIDRMDKLREVRASLIEALGAVPVTDVPRLEALTARYRRGSPQADLANVLIAGDYTLEITALERNLGELATPSIQTVQMVMIESIPLPAEFQSHAKADTAE
jgi:hypothetical protein